MKTFLVVVTALLLSFCIAAKAETVEEIRMASEAAPSHITNKATYLKFTDGDFEVIKGGSNNFTCFVVSDPKGRYEPACLNEQAMRSVFPTYKLEMSSLYSGMTYEETRKKMILAYKSGAIPTAEVGSLVYMMSPKNKIYDPNSKKLEPTPIHHMYFYPKLDDRTFSLKGGPPWLWQGFPHMSALIVVVSNDSP